MKVESKFKVGSIVWFVYDEKIRRGRVILIKMPNFIQIGADCIVDDAYYTMQILNDDDTIWGISDSKIESEVFATREELIRTCATTQIGLFELCKMVGRLDLHEEMVKRIFEQDLTWVGIKNECGNLLKKVVGGVSNGI